MSKERERERETETETELETETETERERSICKFMNVALTITIFYSKPTTATTMLATVVHLI